MSDAESELEYLRQQGSPAVLLPSSSSLSGSTGRATRLALIELVSGSFCFMLKLTPFDLELSSTSPCRYKTGYETETKPDVHKLNSWHLEMCQMATLEYSWY